MDEGAARAGAIYDEIGRTYASTRRPDPRVEAAIRAALGDEVVLTAPKSALGHLVGAAGAVESIVTLLSVVRGVVPPTLNLERKAPEVTLDVVAGGPRELPMTAAVCNSFGFGGLNVSLVLTA